MAFSTCSLFQFKLQLLLLILIFVMIGGQQETGSGDDGTDKVGLTNTTNGSGVDTNRTSTTEPTLRGNVTFRIKPEFYTGSNDSRTKFLIELLGEEAQVGQPHYAAEPLAKIYWNSQNCKRPGDADGGARFDECVVSTVSVAVVYNDKPEDPKAFFTLASPRYAALKCVRDTNSSTTSCQCAISGTTWDKDACTFGGKKKKGEECFHPKDCEKKLACVFDIKGSERNQSNYLASIPRLVCSNASLIKGLYQGFLLIIAILVIRCQNYYQSLN